MDMKSSAAETVGVSGEPSAQIRQQQASSEGARASAPIAASTSQDAAVWERVLDSLKQELGPATFMSWCARLQCTAGSHEAERVILAPTAFCADWVRRNIQEHIEALWQQHGGEVVSFDVRHETKAPGRTSWPRPKSTAPSAAPASAAPRGSVPLPSAVNQQTFANFVESPANAFAVSMARSLANAAEATPSQLVMFHGPYGNGKTHLLKAMAHKAAHDHGQKVVSLTAENFVQGFVQAVMSRQAEAFKSDLRQADFVLLDDVHFIAGKTSSQDELTSALDDLLAAGKRVALAADRPAAALENISPRLRSRLMGALACPVQAADRNLRQAFLQARLDQMQAMGESLEIEADVLDWLADSVADSIRALEGAWVTVVARARAGSGPLTLEAAREVLSHYAQVKERKITVDDIQRKVAGHYNVRLADLLSPSRARNLARPRQVAMYLTKQLTTRSLPDIGRRFGGRDHTTVLHAVKRIDALMQEDESFAQDVLSLRRALQM